MYISLNKIWFPGTLSHLQVATFITKGATVNNFIAYCRHCEQSCRHYYWESQIEHLKVPGHILPETRTITPPSPSPTVHHPTAHPPHILDWVYMYSTVIFHDTMQVASMDSTAVITIYVCGHHNSEDTCKTVSLHVKMPNALHTHPSTYNVYIYTRDNLLTDSPLPAPLQHGPTWQH